MKVVLRTILGVVVGYALMAILITLVQEAWFGGVAWGETPIGKLLLAGLLTCVAALVGGVVATLVARPAGRIAAVIAGFLVVVETT